MQTDTFKCTLLAINITLAVKETLLHRDERWKLRLQIEEEETRLRGEEKKCLLKQNSINTIRKTTKKGFIWKQQMYS